VGESISGALLIPIYIFYHYAARIRRPNKRIQCSTHGKSSLRTNISNLTQIPLNNRNRWEQTVSTGFLIIKGLPKGCCVGISFTVFNLQHPEVYLYNIEFKKPVLIHRNELRHR
jgi:hypothetical protein